MPNQKPTLKFSKRTQDAAHKLISDLQARFSVKDTMFPMDEQLFDNLVYQAFAQFEQGGQGLIEIQDCSLSLDKITAIQFDNNSQFARPGDKSGLRCRIITTDGNLFTFFNSDARRIKSFCKKYQVELGEN